MNQYMTYLTHITFNKTTSISLIWQAKKGKCVYCLNCLEETRYENIIFKKALKILFSSP